MGERSGPFWDGVEGRAPVPPAAATLGLQFIGADIDRGTIELAFDTREEFTNPVGNVLGAFVPTMLDDTVGPALLATLRPDEFQSTHAISRSRMRADRENADLLTLAAVSMNESLWSGPRSGGRYALRNRQNHYSEACRGP